MSRHERRLYFKLVPRALDDRTNVRFLLAVQTSLKESGKMFGPLNNQSYYCYLDYECSLAQIRNNGVARDSKDTRHAGSHARPVSIRRNTRLVRAVLLLSASFNEASDQKLSSMNGPAYFSFSPGSSVARKN